ncbi:hypothetical protein [Pseudovibrio sp. WM33]|uniref:hypothetical protein n=1 Tax=Pseudovibrio sp. WM33 TaxID=1735585 RepID=UPI0007AE9BA8|nr:hypothetical protein [Pseudovibrio sp. WM33]KZL23681.1 hypothetical protein PsWM33_02969 [Pseudovibrio sp. WM33]
MVFDYIIYLVVGLLASIAWNTYRLRELNYRVNKKLDGLGGDLGFFGTTSRKLERIERRLEMLEHYARSFDRYGLPDQLERERIDQRILEREAHYEDGFIDEREERLQAVIDEVKAERLKEE